MAFQFKKKRKECKKTKQWINLKHDKVEGRYKEINKIDGGPGHARGTTEDREELKITSKRYC